TFSTSDVLDGQGNRVAVMERRYRSKGLLDALQNTVAPTFTLRDPAISDKNRNVIAEGKPVIIDTRRPTDGLRNVIHVEDADGNRVGSIRERWSSKLGGLLQRELF